MEIDLTDVPNYEDDSILLNKKVNFIFGKNGTGKSTMVDLIRKQKQNDRDLYIFQGFESVLGSDQKLEAVVLGEENKKINSQIKEKNKEIKHLKEKNENLDKLISESVSDNEANFYSEYNEAKLKRTSKEKEIEKFFQDAAREIIEKGNLVENTKNRSYNKKAFKQEYENSKLLEENERKKLFDTLITSKKIASPITFPQINLEKYLLSVNDILQTKVTAKIMIDEFKNSTDKMQFAEKGLALHNENEKCAFCGNIVQPERIQSLKSYFSADEVEELVNRIDSGEQRINDALCLLEKLQIIPNNFYPEFEEKANELNSALLHKKSAQIKYFTELLTALAEKRKSLFNEVPGLFLTLPDDFEELRKEYAVLVESNEQYTINILENQKRARNTLRSHEVKKLITAFGLDIKSAELNILLENEEKSKEKVAKTEKEIGDIKKEIDTLNNQIAILVTQTKNTKKLAENINKRLQIYVSFKLVRTEKDQREFYEIIDGDDNVRPITALSTGEKNIIAFLYFVEKLNEEKITQFEKPRIIVFDDPMNSNDDTMQYLIVEELQQIIDKCSKKTCNDMFILLTHNVFFYLNCSHKTKKNYTSENPFEENNFYRLLSNTSKTKVLRLKNAGQDFRTNYEALWSELVFLYDLNKTEMMLNPIRRIIETYIIFNGISGFYKDNKNAQYLFNINSHYFPDIEVDLNALTREEIKEIVKKCFRDNNAEAHFNKHWKNAEKLLK